MLNVILLFFFSGNIFAYEIITQYTEKHFLEGGKVTLSCNYVIGNIRSWQWYRQYPNTASEFILESFESLGPQQKVAEAQKGQRSPGDLQN